MDSREEDLALMERVKVGDQKAFEALVIRHRTKAVCFAYSFVSDLYEAEDIVQECFAGIYVNRMSYKPLCSFKTYLFTVIRNACIDYLRWAKKNFTVALDDIPDTPNPMADVVPDDSFIKTERMAAIFRHLDSLPKDYRTALYLLAVDDMPYNEIAAIMRKSLPQVKIIIHRARKKLKNLCEGDDIL